MIRTLSCHCGRVRLECNAPLEELVECNCSTCARHGLLSWKVKPQQVRLATPRIGLSTYQWRDHDGGTHFCPVCGTVMSRTGWTYFRLNARCLDGVDIFTLPVRRYDGLHDMPADDMPPLADPDAEETRNG